MRLRSAHELASTYVIRPLIAVVICALVAFVVEPTPTGIKQLSLATPTVAALAVSVFDMNRRAFAAAGFSGAAVFGLVVAALDVADTVTGYDIGFLVEWAIVGAFSGLPVYAINFVWGALGQIREGIDDIYEIRAERAREASATTAAPVEPAASSDPTGTSPVVPVGPVTSPPGPAGPVTEATAATLATATNPSLAGEELVAGLEAYQVGGQPWWRCDEANVMVQYRDRAQLEIESRVVSTYGWKRAAPPALQRGASIKRRPGGFTFRFGLGPRLPEDDLTVMWVRS